MNTDSYSRYSNQIHSFLKYSMYSSIFLGFWLFKKIAILFVGRKKGSSRAASSSAAYMYWEGIVCWILCLFCLLHRSTLSGEYFLNILFIFTQYSLLNIHSNSWHPQCWLTKSVAQMVRVATRLHHRQTLCLCFSGRGFFLSFWSPIWYFPPINYAFFFAHAKLIDCAHGFKRQKSFGAAWWSRLKLLFFWLGDDRNQSMRKRCSHMEKKIQRPKKSPSDMTFLARVCQFLPDACAKSAKVCQWKSRLWVRLDRHWLHSRRRQLRAQQCFNILMF